MRLFIINYLKQHPVILRIFWQIVGRIFSIISKMLNIKPKNMLFASYGGRKFDDSPKAIYDEICKRKEFDGWNLIWAFVEPDKFDIPRGHKVKIDTLSFFKALLTSQVWISNSGMSRGIEYKDDRIIKVETWHGSVTKKSCGEENQSNKYTIGGGGKSKTPVDVSTIRCAQSQIDIDILSRLFNASKNSFLKEGFPRNDELAKAKTCDYITAKKRLGLPLYRKVILYMPTWRQYDIDNKNEIYCKPPINLNHWKEKLGDKYILLVRAHYAVSKALNIQNDNFVINVSDYPNVNDLYLASDLLLTDYSSAMIDFSVLEKPILCFAYDYEVFLEKIGMFIDLPKELPNCFFKDENSLLDFISNMNWAICINVVKVFKSKHANFIKGKGSEIVVETILKRVNFT